MKRLIKISAAISEPIIVFVAGALIFKSTFTAVVKLFAGYPLTQWASVGRVCVIVLVACVVDMLFRKRGFREWGLGGNKIARDTFWDGWFLLITGAVIPLGLTWMFPSVLGVNSEIQFTSLLVPVISQEIFLLGYARSRFSDVLPEQGVATVIVLLFLAAHFNHTAREPVGLLFLLAMGWQGFTWDRYLQRNNSLVPLILAHLILLLLYYVPGIGFAILCAGIALKPYRRWLILLFQSGSARGN